MWSMTASSASQTPPRGQHENRTRPEGHHQRQEHPRSRTTRRDTSVSAMTQDPSQELLTLELARLDSLYAEALKAVRSFTPVLHNGRVVQIPIIDTNGDTIKHPETGQPLTCIAQDRQPVLAGIACAVRIAERRSKLLGLDAPIRAQQEVTVTGSGQPDIGHLSVEDLESIKQKLYGGQKLLATTPAEGETEQ